MTSISGFFWSTNSPKPKRVIYYTVNPRKEANIHIWQHGMIRFGVFSFENELVKYQNSF